MLNVPGTAGRAGRPAPRDVRRGSGGAVGAARRRGLRHGYRRARRHVAGCAACRDWPGRALDAARPLRVQAAPALPDMVDAVQERLRTARLPQPRRGVLRGALTGAAVLQLLLSVPALVLGHQGHADVHTAREVGVVDLALAVGVLAAAHRPWRAAGMLPVVAVLAAGLAVTSLLDLVAGETTVRAELPHLIALVETLLLWRLRPRPHRRRPGTTAPATGRVSRPGPVARGARGSPLPWRALLAVLGGTVTAPALAHAALLDTDPTTGGPAGRAARGRADLQRAGRHGTRRRQGRRPRRRRVDRGHVTERASAARSSCRCSTVSGRGRTRCSGGS